jgi:hypothetical protein
MMIRIIVIREINARSMKGIRAAIKNGIEVMKKVIKS